LLTQTPCSILQAGASKVFISSRKAAACDEAVKALNALPNLQPGAKAYSVPADSATVDGVNHLVAEVAKHTDTVDILFANAGASWGEPFDTHPDSAFSKIMDLNVKAVFNTIQRFTPMLEKNATKADPARVLITASVAGRGVGPLFKQGAYGYSASKAAVIHLGRNLAVELGPRHIAVNSICPGFFPSKMSNGLMKMSGGADKIAQRSPLGKLGQAEDIAGIVVYLSSRAGSHVNGEAIAVDGGAMWVGGELMGSPEPKL
jgi:NAD(P)-dependent dehydrogenase (short-subunit alcohol dehydrogenase family)